MKKFKFHVKTPNKTGQHHQMVKQRKNVALPHFDSMNCDVTHPCDTSLNQNLYLSSHHLTITLLYNVY